MLNLLNKKPPAVAAPLVPAAVPAIWSVDDQPEVLAAFKKQQALEDETQSRRATQSAVLNERNALAIEIQGLMVENDASHLAAHRDGRKVLGDIAQTDRYDRLQTLERDVRILDDRLAALQKDWNASGLDKELSLATDRWVDVRYKARELRRREIKSAACRNITNLMFRAINQMRADSVESAGDSAADLFINIRDSLVREYITPHEQFLATTAARSADVAA